MVEIIDEEKIIQKLWDRIKKPAAGKSSIKLERMLRHENTILGIPANGAIEFVAE